MNCVLVLEKQYRIDEDQPVYGFRLLTEDRAGQLDGGDHDSQVASLKWLGEFIDDSTIEIVKVKMVTAHQVKGDMWIEIFEDWLGDWHGEVVSRPNFPNHWSPSKHVWMDDEAYATPEEVLNDLKMYVENLEAK